METTQKKVTFNNRVQRRFIECAPSMERTNLWYRASDFAEARERDSIIRNCIQQKEEMYSQFADDLVSEGIFTIEEMVIKNITVDNAICAVLDEQERQEAEDYDDDDNDVPFVLNDDEIAEEYRVHSRVSLAQAQNRARHLAQHMRDIESQSDDEELPPPPPPPRQGSPNQRRSPGRSPASAKSKMSLVRRRTHYGRQVVRREDAPQVVRCTNPAA